MNKLKLLLVPLAILVAISVYVVGLREMNIGREEANFQKTKASMEMMRIGANRTVYFWRDSKFSQDEKKSIQLFLGDLTNLQKETFLGISKYPQWVILTLSDGKFVIAVGEGRDFKEAFIALLNATEHKTRASVS